jgi:hypothetical protein
MRKKLLVNVVIIIWAVIAGIFASIKPWQMYRKQNEEARIHEKQAHDAENKLDQVQRTEARKKSPQGRLEDIRKHGYMKDGEISPDPNKP